MQNQTMEAVLALAEEVILANPCFPIEDMVFSSTGYAWRANGQDVPKQLWPAMAEAAAAMAVDEPDGGELMDIMRIEDDHHVPPKMLFPEPVPADIPDPAPMAAEPAEPATDPLQLSRWKISWEGSVTFNLPFPQRISLDGAVVCVLSACLHMSSRALQASASCAMLIRRPLLVLTYVDRDWLTDLSLSPVSARQRSFQRRALRRLQALLTMRNSLRTAGITMLGLFSPNVMPGSLKAVCWFSDSVHPFCLRQGAAMAVAHPDLPHFAFPSPLHASAAENAALQQSALQPLLVPALSQAEQLNFEDLAQQLPPAAEVDAEIEVQVTDREGADTLLDSIALGLIPLPSALVPIEAQRYLDHRLQFIGQCRQLAAGMQWQMEEEQIPWLDGISPVTLDALRALRASCPSAVPITPQQLLQTDSQLFNMLHSRLTAGRSLHPAALTAYLAHLVVRLPSAELALQVALQELAAHLDTPWQIHADGPAGLLLVAEDLALRIRGSGCEGLLAALDREVQAKERW